MKKIKVKGLGLFLDGVLHEAYPANQDFARILKDGWRQVAILKEVEIVYKDETETPKHLPVNHITE